MAIKFFKPQRYNRANGEREKYCYEYISNRLDLRNVNWLSGGPEVIREWDALEKIAERIALYMRYNAQIEINGKPMSMAEFWDVVKRIEYAPGFDAMYERLNKSWTRRVQWPIKPIVKDDLLNAVYNRVNRTMSKDINHIPARKFKTDDLILPEDEKRRQMAIIAEHEAKTAARANRRRKKSGKE